MSHSIEYFQRMNNEQLLHEMQHAFWAVDRQRAQTVYQRRIQDQRTQQTARAAAQSAAVQQASVRLSQHLADVNRRNTQLEQIVRQQNAALQSQQTAQARQVADLRRAYAEQVERVRRQNTEAIQRLEADATATEARLRQTLQESSAAMLREAQAQLEDQITAVHGELSGQLREQESRIGDMESAFTELQQSDDSLRQNATDFRNAAVAVINAAIEYNNANHHAWRQEELEALTRLRDHVDGDLALGMLTVGATRVQARTLFEGALRYRAGVHADEREWQLRQADALQRIETAMNDLEVSRTIDVDGETVDVDYWTCGDLRRLEGRLEDLQQLAGSPGLSFEELTCIGELAETYRQEIREAVTFAIHALQFSYARKELLEEAVGHVERQLGTLRPQWEEYFAGDNRLGYRVYLTSPTGERVVLTAEPVKDEGGEIRNQFRFDILETGREVHNATEAEQFMREIAGALSSLEGCQFTTARCTHQAAPAEDAGQGERAIWRQPEASDVQTAMERARPVPAPAPDHPSPKPAVAPLSPF